MARRRVFVEEIRRGVAELNGPDAEHLVRVLRVEQGENFELSNNGEVYLAEVEVARKSTVTFHILEALPVPEAEAELLVVPALFKFDSFEWLIEKATELGVSAIQPWEAIRTDRGLAQAAIKRKARWERIGQEASRQSRRVRLPLIEPVVRLARALATDASVRLLLDEDSAAPPILRVLPRERKPTDRIALLLGPEGGWTQGEREQAIAAGWVPCSLGSTILRAETAGVAALAILRAAWQ